MRTVLILFITLVIVGGGFLVYEWLQPARAPRIASPTLSSAPTTAPAGAPANQSIPVSSGEGVYVESYDQKKGYLSRRFRAARYDPQPDGTVKVQKVEAEFYSETGQMMRLKGDNGEIVVPGGGGGGAMARPPMPTRGKLIDVTLMLFPPGARWPSITCNIPNVTFDNDTFMIQTDAFTDSKGNAIAADDVPVAMRGDDYDFDGRGLTIHWDERNRRLARLEIAHGHSVVLKHPKGLGISTTQPASAQPAAQASPRSSTRSTRRTATAPSIATNQPMAAATQETREGDPYRAEFHDNVRIVQGQEELAVAENMNVDFLMGEREPSTQPAITAGSSARSTTRSATRSTAPRSVSDAPRTTAAPTSQLSEEPVIILWTGKLVVSPAPEDVAHPHGKDAIVEMIGNDRQVVAKREGSEVRAAQLRLHTEDDSLFLRNSQKFPQITIKDGNGTSIISRSFEYNGQSHMAQVRGSSHAEFPIKDEESATTKPEQGKPAQIARVDWTQSCTLKMSQDSNAKQLTIESAKLVGDVKVDHPQLQLNAQKLDLDFDPTPKSTKNSQNAALKTMTAEDDVHGRFVDAENPNNPPQTIASQSLKVDFDRAADGRSYPREALAEGDVVSGDGKSELRAKLLRIAMAPATQPTTQPTAHSGTPNVQVEKLFAQQDVRVTSADGQDIRADQLEMKQGKMGPLYTLTGSHSTPARAGDATSTLIGEIIEYEPNTQQARVIGAGQMHAVQQSRSTTRPSTQPIDLTWEQGLEANGRESVINITGNVTATTKLDDGSVNVVQGTHMRIDLADAPTTQPSKPKPTTRPDLFGNSQGFGNKLVKSATVDADKGDVEVRSTLLASNGDLLRRLHLFAPTLVYEVQTKKFIVPVPGKMLFEDKRTDPAAKPGKQPMQITMHGATAFQWNKDFIFDDATHTATMRGEGNGGVDVVHNGQAPNETFKLNARTIIAVMDPSETQADVESGGKLKRVIAEGDVNFTSPRLQFLAQRIEYDPQTQELVARGTPSQPATMLDPNGLSQGTFTELRYNAKTDALKMSDYTATIRRTGS